MASTSHRPYNFELREYARHVSAYLEFLKKLEAAGIRIQLYARTAYPTQDPFSFANKAIWSI